MLAVCRCCFIPPIIGAFSLQRNHNHCLERGRAMSQSGVGIRESFPPIPPAWRTEAAASGGDEAGSLGFQEDEKGLIAQRQAIAAWIGSSLEDLIFGMQHDGLGVAHRVRQGTNLGYDMAELA